MQDRLKRSAELSIVIAAVIEGLYPVIIHRGTELLPPLLFGALSLLLSAIVHFVAAISVGRLKDALSLRAFGHILGVTLFIVIIPTALILSGTRLTSGINTGLLLQMELPLTMFLYGLFLHESISRRQLAGAALIFLGTIAILAPGRLVLQSGDLLILAATASYPIGNWFAKAVLRDMHPSTLLFFRSLLGGVVLLMGSFLIENPLAQGGWDASAFWIIAAYGMVVLVGSKFLWYRGLRHLSVTKAVSILSITPVFSLIAAIAFLGERPSVWQWVGFFLIAVGLPILTGRSRAKDVVVAV